MTNAAGIGTPFGGSLIPGVAVGSPSGFYCTGDESLRITSFGSVASVELAVRTRFLRVDGYPVAGSERHAPNSDRTSATTTVHLTDGWLLGC